MTTKFSSGHQQYRCLLFITMRSLLLRISILCLLLQRILDFFPKKLRSIFLAKTNSMQGCLVGKEPEQEPESKAVAAVNEVELRRVFQLFDHDGDGRITREELRDSLENLGIFMSEGDLAATVKSIDANGDGCVDIDEFGAVYEMIVGGGRGREEEEEDMREAFGVFDVDGDGYITVEELRSVLGTLGLRQGRTAEDCRRMIGKVDGDGDGRVSFKEFKEMMKVGGLANALN